MKKTNLLIWLFCLCLCHEMVAQTISLGTNSGAGSTNVLLSTSTTTNKYSRTISVYTASEIITAGGAAGNIISLGWNKNGTGEYTFGDAYIKVYLKPVSNTAWSTSPVPDWSTEVMGATEVYTSSSYSIPTGTGWKTVTFTNPFPWNGTDNIAVFVDWYRPSTPTADISWGRSTTTNANACRVGGTLASLTPLLVNSNRPLLQLTFNGSTTPITDIDVTTAGSVPSVITTNGGTLQMQSIILPATANQAVTWSIVPGTGTATISATGLVTAQTNGTVWAKAVSVQDVNWKDSLLVTISNQIVPITSIDVTTAGSVPSVITTNGGTLQMQSTILPATANQSVTWSIVPGTGTATISATGLVTAQTNGTVWAKAISVQNTTWKDSLLVTISNQVVPITSIDVTTAGSVPSVITTNSGTLQMQSTILPATANQAVTWSIVTGTGTATISATGLVTAQTNGTVWAKAVSVQNTTWKDSLLVTISNQTVPITSIDVTTAGSVPSVITTNGSTLQMQSTILPATANQAVTWSIVTGTGTATISATGLVTAQTNGTVWAKAVSVQDANWKDSLLVTISNQVVPITSIDVTTAGSVPSVITTNGGTLQMQSTILPATSNQSVTWSIVPGTGTATISATGLVTAQTNGTVWAKAVSVQDANWKDSLLVTISNQVVPITSIDVTTAGSVPSVITTNGGTLQMQSTILPATANQAVTWNIVPGTGTATISATGLVTAQTNGTVWAKAIAVADNMFKDSLQITISNQTVGIDEVARYIGFKIYPNPISSGVLNIEVAPQSFNGNANIYIIDALGRVLKTAKMQSYKYSIDVEALPTGTYLIKYEENENKVVYKFSIK